MVEKQKSIISLITDFGLNGSHYVASMKGVILKINPLVNIIDISHSITPYSIIEASYILKSTYKYFPENTIFIIVVDPGVGSSREIIALKTKSNHIFIGPNNGIFGNVFEMNEIKLCNIIENEKYFIKPLSNTFHGRDIMAPAAAHLTLEGKLEDLGLEFTLDNIKSVALGYEILNNGTKIKCYIQNIDHFGNGITNFSLLEGFNKKSLQVKDKITLEHRDQTYSGIFTTHFSKHNPKSLLFLKGSTGYLEISMNQENAASYIGFKVGDLIYINL